MLDYCVAVTQDATQVSRADIDALRTHGFDDRAILQMTLITGWFNYINRVADALGVGREDPAGVALPIPPEALWAEAPNVAATNGAIAQVATAKGAASGAQKELGTS